MKIAVITGASSGIGEEFVRQESSDLDIEEIWMIARREARLETLARQVHKKTKILPIDLSIQDNMNQFKMLLLEEKPDIKLLVNCAGYGIRKNFINGTYDEEIGMIDMNCKSLTAVTYFCIPYMHENSRIIQIASAAAFLPQAGFAVYSASKAYVLSFSRALNQELKKQHIYVTAVCPGPVDTEFFAISDAGSKMPAYKKLFLVKKEKVVKKALKDSRKRKSISMYGFYIKILRVFARFM